LAFQKTTGLVTPFKCQITGVILADVSPVISTAVDLNVGLRVLVDVEEIVAAQVLVALRHGWNDTGSIEWSRWTALASGLPHPS